MNISSRKAAILDSSEKNAAYRQKFWKRAAFFHEEDLRYLRFLIPDGLRVLELGCGTGNTIAALKRSFGIGSACSMITNGCGNRNRSFVEFTMTCTTASQPPASMGRQLKSAAELASSNLDFPM